MDSKDRKITFGFLGLFIILVFGSIFLSQLNTSEEADGKIEEENVVENVELDPTIPAFSGEELTAVPNENWIANGGNIYNQRYSTLDEINSSNIKI